MKKKYYEPEVELLDFVCNCLTGSFQEGDSLWDNETPLIPFE